MCQICRNFSPNIVFLSYLGLALDKWIQFKQETDPFWKNGAKVILSGPDVPGEGEHKVMDYIRELQEETDKTTDLHHVLYGLDAGKDYTNSSMSFFTKYHTQN